MRNIQKQIAQGQEIAAARQRLDLTVSEVNCLRTRFSEKEAAEGKAGAVLDLIAAAYFAGLAVGTRNA